MGGRLVNFEYVQAHSDLILLCLESIELCVHPFNELDGFWDGHFSFEGTFGFKLL